MLTWWQGYIPPNGFGEGEEIIANSSYEQIAHIRPGNGYLADLHDFHIYPNDTAVLTVFNTIHCNLTSVAGARDGAVTDGVFQEIDLRTNLVRREWHSLDHVALSESYSSALKAEAVWPFDYFHLNSVQVNAAAGTTLLSARDTWGLYRINSKTGQVITTAGTKHSTVTMGPGTSTAYQHDATELPDGDISVFDNGGVPNVHPQSRALILALTGRTDTLVASYEHPGALSSGSQGNVQVLGDGNLFVGWGAQSYVSEFSPGGELLFDAQMPSSDESYRAYRFAWSGTPPSVPAIAASAPSTSAPVTVYASWNGATEVAGWNVLAGATPQQLSFAGTAPRSGFETPIATSGPAAYVEAQALNAQGTVIGTSAVIKG